LKSDHESKLFVICAPSICRHAHRMPVTRPSGCSNPENEPRHATTIDGRPRNVFNAARSNRAWISGGASL
jgi:hypothetical protein